MNEGAERGVGGRDRTETKKRLEDNKLALYTLSDIIHVIVFNILIERVGNFHA